MSIAEELRYWVREGRLFPLEPALPSGRILRNLYVSPEINDLVHGPWTSRDEEYKWGKVRADFDRFIERKLISLALDNPYKKNKTTYLARLDPLGDEVWEIRSRDPAPGVRVFGRFAECDKFVAFNWGYRKDLGGPGSREFRFEINRAKSEWRKLFPTYEPVSGGSLHDYVSEECFLV
jgi:hypothetical protein